MGLLLESLASMPWPLPYLCQSCDSWPGCGAVPRGKLPAAAVPVSLGAPGIHCSQGCGPDQGSAAQQEAGHQGQAGYLGHLCTGRQVLVGLAKLFETGYMYTVAAGMHVCWFEHVVLP